MSKDSISFRTFKDGWTLRVPGLIVHRHDGSVTRRCWRFIRL